MDRIRYELILEDGTRVKAVGLPAVNFSSLFGTISFTLKKDDYVNLIDRTLRYRIVLNGTTVFLCSFVITDYTKTIQYGDFTHSYSGYTNSYRISESYLGRLPNIEYRNIGELFDILNSQFTEPLGVKLYAPFAYDLTDKDLSTEDTTIPNLLNSISDILGIEFRTDLTGNNIKPYIPKYTTNDLTSYKVLNLSSLLFSKEERFTKGEDYNAVIVTDIDNIAGEIQIETEMIDNTSYYVYVYTSPLVSEFEFSNLESSDGDIIKIDHSESFTVEEFVNFTNDTTQVKYPIKDVLSITFYNLPNNLVWSVGSRDIQIETSDDLAVGKIVYTTERSSFKLFNLSEPYVKIKAEVYNGD